MVYSRENFDQLLEEQAVSHSQIDQLKSENRLLQEKVQCLMKKLFGRSSVFSMHMNFMAIHSNFHRDTTSTQRKRLSRKNPKKNSKVSSTQQKINSKQPLSSSAAELQHPNSPHKMSHEQAPGNRNLNECDLLNIPFSHHLLPFFLKQQPQRAINQCHNPEPK